MDVANDAANCGACGHDCGAAACSAGVCMPESLAVVSNPPADQLVLDGDDLVFATRGELTSSGSVYRVARTDGRTTAVYRGLADYPSLAVQSDHAIVVGDTAQLGGCDTTRTSGELVSLGPTVSVLSMGRRCVGSLTATSTVLAWIENDPRNFLGGDMPQPALSVLDASAPPGSPLVVSRQLPANTPLQVANVDDALMWIEGNALMQSTNGSSPVLVASASSAIVAFTADASDIAYATVSGQIVVHSRSSGMDTTLTDSVMYADSIALDGNFVFVATQPGLVAIDRQTGEQHALASGWVRALAEDDAFVYFLREVKRGTADQTEVVRLRKPATPLLQVSAPLVCAAPLEMCSSAEGCADPRTDLAHCGACETACASSDTCSAGACACGANSLVCGGACIDQETDANNCGACGRSCNGGMCVGGDCMPVQLAPFGEAAVHDATAVYFAANSQLYRLDKSTLASSLMADVSAPYNYLRYLAQDATHVFMAADMGTIGSTNPGCIYVVAKTGSTSATTLYTNRSDPSYIAAATNALVWVEDTNTLIYAAPDGSGIHGSFTASTLYSGAADDVTAGVAVAGSTVYWLLRDPTANQGAIVQVDLAASQPQASLVTELAISPASIAIVGTTLYVIGGWPDGQVLSMPLAGGPLTILVRGLTYPASLTAAADGLLWIAGNFPAVIYDRATDGAVPRIVQSGNNVDYTNVLCVDADRLFTVSSNGVFVMQR